MGTTMESRINSTQAKDAIYKAYELVGQDLVTQSELDALALSSGNLTAKQIANLEILDSGNYEKEKVLGFLNSSSTGVLGQEREWINDKPFPSDGFINYATIKVSGVATYRITIYDQVINDSGREFFHSDSFLDFNLQSGVNNIALFVKVKAGQYIGTKKISGDGNFYQTTVALGADGNLSIDSTTGALLNRTIYTPCWEFGKYIGNLYSILEQGLENALDISQLIEKTVLVDSISSDSLSLSMYNRGNSSKSYVSKKVGILVAGQSNTQGRVPLSTQPPSWYDSASPIIPNVKKWNNDSKKWETYSVPSLWAYDTQVFKEISEFMAEDIYIIKHANGGTAISEKANPTVSCWQPIFELPATSVRKLTQEFEEYIRSALETSLTNNFEIRFFLWHQGESDSLTVDSQNDYYQNLKNLIYYVRGVVNNPILPFVFGSISHSSLQYNSIIEEAHFKIAEEDENAYIVNMQDGTLLDPYHFDGVSSEYLGSAMSTIIKENIL